MPVISGNTSRKGRIVRLIPIAEAIREEDNEIEIAWEGRGDNSREWHRELGTVYHYDKSETLFSCINDTSYSADNKGNFNHARDESAVMMHLMEEVGEVALEVSIHNGTSYKKPSEDGVVGEAIDVIINALDLIHVHNPNLTEEDLIAIATRKCSKWLSKVARTDLAK